jgi:tetratricopeptide (TPR) repeat protein
MAAKALATPHRNCKKRAAARRGGAELTMRHLCVHCDEQFELAPDQEVRCPKCMRVNGIRALGAAPAAAASTARKPRLGVALIMVLVLLGAGGGAAYVRWQREENPDPVALATTPLSERVVQRQLEQRGVNADALAHLLDADAAVEALAKRATAGANNPADKARALVKALRARAQAQAFAPWSLTDPREGAVHVAAETAKGIEKDGARAQLYPLEVAALGVSALRSADVPAMLVEVFAWPGERVPLDPSGRFGYFAIGLHEGKAWRVLDAYGGRAEQAGCTECTQLGDLEAIGAALSLRATQRLANNEDPARALRDADVAIKLLPGSASVRGARGAVLLANGANEAGQSELEAAAQMRGDGPRKNNLAMLALALGDGERAAREISQVLEQQPDFALAHITLAQVQLATGERDQARAEIDKAESLDPHMPLIPLTRAQYFAMANQNDQAVAEARRAVQARPNDPQVHLLLARIQRQAGQYEAMRAEARTVMKLVPAELSSRTHDLLEHLLGPTAFEPDVAPDSDTAPRAAAPSDSAQLALPAPGASDAPHLQLRDPQSAPSAGTLQPGGAAPKLRLQAPGNGLKLDGP